MKPALLCIHIYYADMWKELKNHIENITIPFDLVVTMVAENPDLIKEIKKDFPNAKIEIVANRGYDVGPFIHVIKNTNLDNYSFIIKLHTKRDMATGTIYGNQDFSGDRWRRALLDIISSKTKFSRIIAGFYNNPKIGMVANYRVHHNGFAFKTKELYATIKKLMDKMGLKLKHCKHIAGTMFIARANLFKPLQKLNIDIDNFEIPDKTHTQSTAHTFERLLGYIIYAQGYTIKDCYTPKFELYIKEPLRIIKNKICYFIYHKKITTRNKLIVKILKIPVYHKNLNK